MTKQIITGFIALALGLGLYFYTTIKPEGYRPDFAMLDVEGDMRDMNEWNGKVIIINFWATWCPPCIREIPSFIKLQDQYEEQGLVIIGIALDEKQAAIDFVDPMGINYPVLVGEQQGLDLTIKYGNKNGILPYTVIIDRNGVMQHKIISEVFYEDAVKMIEPLL